MAFRDREGHFISRARAIELGIIDENGNPITETQEPAEEPETLDEELEDEDEEEVEAEDYGRWADRAHHPTETVFIDTGRGGTAEVPAGSPFEMTVDRIAEEAHYGGFYRVFLNGSEVVRPEDAPESIEPGMRIAITAYDKVG